MHPAPAPLTPFSFFPFPFFHTVHTCHLLNRYATILPTSMANQIIHFYFLPRIHPKGLNVNNLLRRVRLICLACSVLCISIRSQRSYMQTRTNCLCSPPYVCADLHVCNVRSALNPVTHVPKEPLAGLPSFFTDRVRKSEVREKTFMHASR